MQSPLFFHTTVFRTIFALVRSVAVHSMNTFLVLRVMAECAPLIIGGNDNTVLHNKQIPLTVTKLVALKSKLRACTIPIQNKSEYNESYSCVMLYFSDGRTYRIIRVVKRKGKYMNGSVQIYIEIFRLGSSLNQALSNIFRHYS